MQSELLGIFVAKGRSLPMETIDAAEAVADCGIKGDRYFTQEGTFSKNKNKSRDITLIEIESIWL